MTLIHFFSLWPPPANCLPSLSSTSRNCINSQNSKAMSSFLPKIVPLLLLLLLLLLLGYGLPEAVAEEFSSFSAANSPWLPTQNRTLVSPTGTFAAGFVQDRDSRSLFTFAVWVQISAAKTVVWSIERQVGSSSALTVSPRGDISLNDSSGNNIWPKEAGASSSNASRLVLGEDGQLVFGQWSSFDFPTDTILANQTFPSRNPTLARGNYKLTNAFSLFFNNSDNFWNATATIRNFTTDGQLLMDNSKIFITSDYQKIVLRRLTLDSDGNLRIYSLNNSSGTWTLVWQAVQELCTISGTCGANSICVPAESNSTNCVCPPEYRNASGNSCVLKKQYGSSNKFLELDFVTFTKGPDKTDLTPLNLGVCQSRCLSNQSCIGFSYKFIGLRTCVHYSRPSPTQKGRVRALPFF